MRDLTIVQLTFKLNCVTRAYWWGPSLALGMTTLIAAFHFGRGTTRGAARALRSAAANSLRSQPEKNIRAGNLDSD
ncbi:MAG: hypothetical protein DME42_00235 [Verrucomicrobia bacterium]|nr:MAG: hypothetical protein DME42_00235 [Verrucomicrobiota bacterium]